MSSFNENHLEEVSWDDESIKPSRQSLQSRKFERFKAKKGQTQRILILDTNPVMVYQHYKKEFGYLRCLKTTNPPMRCAACDSGDKPTQKFGVNVLSYPDGVESGGSLDRANLKVQAWLFGVGSFGELKNIKAEWGPLDTYDLKINCTNEQFQHISVTPCKGRLYDSAINPDDIQTYIGEEKYDLKKRIGGALTEDQMSGAWSGKLSRDDVFKKKDDDQRSSSLTDDLPTATDSTPATAAPAKLDFNSLLGRG